MIGVVMLLSDIAFSPALTAIVTAAAVLACGTFWCVLPLARRHAVEPGRGSARPAGSAAYAATRRCLIRTASIRFWRTDSTRIENPLAAIVSPRLGSRPSSANTNPPTEL